MTVLLWRTFLALLVVRLSIVGGVNCIWLAYCKGAKGKKGDKILAGSSHGKHSKINEMEELFQEFSWQGVL